MGGGGRAGGAVRAPGEALRPALLTASSLCPPHSLPAPGQAHAGRLRSSHSSQYEVMRRRCFGVVWAARGAGLSSSGVCVCVCVCVCSCARVCVCVCVPRVGVHRGGVCRWGACTGGGRLCVQQPQGGPCPIVGHPDGVVPLSNTLGCSPWPASAANPTLGLSRRPGANICLQSYRAAQGDPDQPSTAVPKAEGWWVRAGWTRCPPVLPAQPPQRRVRRATPTAVRTAVPQPSRHTRGAGVRPQPQPCCVPAHSLHTQPLALPAPCTPASRTQHPRTCTRGLVRACNQPAARRHVCTHLHARPVTAPAVHPDSPWG